MQTPGMGRRCIECVCLPGLALLLSACGGGEKSAEATSTTVAADTITWQSGDFTVPADEDFECFYTDVITDKEISVLSAAAEQGQGGHHVSVYYVDNKRPPGRVQCSGTTEMIDWHFVVGAGGEGNTLQTNGIVSLPEGLAIKVPKGKQFMVQTHYINVTGEPLTVNDKLVIHLIDPSKVKAYASDFVIDNEEFQLDPQSKLTATLTCTLQSDLSLAMLLGHMHEHGSHYKLETIDSAGAALSTVYETDWMPSYASHPPIDKFTMEKPLQFPKGTRFRQTCDWNNATDKTYIFPTEMCIGFGYYFPGESRMMCQKDPVP